MKQEIRKLNKTIRSAMAPCEAKRKSRAAAKAFLLSDIYKNSSCIMLYMPLGNETDTSDIINAAFDDGKKVAFPVTDPGSCGITPCYAKRDTLFRKGAFSVREPGSDYTADLCDIDVIVVPGIAFDRNGNRIGFGKGCYDRLLRQACAYKIGLCYDFQLCEKIAVDEHDISMDFVVTESGIIRCR